MADLVLPAEGDKCPECGATLYVGVDCSCGKCPAEKPRALEICENCDRTTTGLVWHREIDMELCDICDKYLAEYDALLAADTEEQKQIENERFRTNGEKADL